MTLQNSGVLSAASCINSARPGFILFMIVLLSILPIQTAVFVPFSVQAMLSLGVQRSSIVEY